jgi:hypothetical protein
MGGGGKRWMGSLQARKRTQKKEKERGKGCSSYDCVSRWKEEVGAKIE